MRRIKTKIDFFNDEVVMVIVGTPAETIKYMKKAHNEPNFDFDSETYAGLTFSKPGYCEKIWLPRIPKTPREKSTLVHELMHVTFNILKYRGMKYDPDTSEEVFTHLLGFLTKEIFTKLKI